MRSLSNFTSLSLSLFFFRILTCVAACSSGPYVTYEWPVIHPQSAVHQ
jgi:hypothetical protein